MKNIIITDLEKLRELTIKNVNDITRRDEILHEIDNIIAEVKNGHR